MIHILLLWPLAVLSFFARFVRRYVSRGAGDKLSYWASLTFRRAAADTQPR